MKSTNTVKVISLDTDNSTKTQDVSVAEAKKMLKDVLNGGKKKRD